jgi:hypothetical protein
MNQKKAKQLRKIARLYQEHGVTTGETVRYGYVGRSKLEAAEGQPPQGPTVIDPNCQKGVYRELKRRVHGRSKFALPQPKAPQPAAEPGNVPAQEPAAQ